MVNYSVPNRACGVPFSLIITKLLHFNFKCRKLYSGFLFKEEGLKLFSFQEISTRTSQWNELTVIDYTGNGIVEQSSHRFSPEIWTITPGGIKQFVLQNGPCDFRMFDLEYNPIARYSDTSDGGVTWGEVVDSTLQTGTEYRFYDPNLYRNQDDAIGVIWEERDSEGDYGKGLNFAISNDAGTTWGYTENVGGEELPGRNFPKLISSGCSWFVFFNKYPHESDANFPHNVYYTRSLDNGLTWSDPYPMHINTNVDGLAFDVSVQVAEYRGTIVVVWYSNSSSDESKQIELNSWYSYSEDQGHTWSAPNILREEAFILDIAYIGQDKFLVVWQEDESDIFYTTLTIPGLEEKVPLDCEVLEYKSDGFIPVSCGVPPVSDINTGDWVLLMGLVAGAITCLGHGRRRSR